MDTYSGRAPDGLSIHEVACCAVEQWLKSVGRGKPVPLLETKGDGVTAKLNRADQRLVRSELLTERLRRIRAEARTQFNRKQGVLPEGICYLIYRCDDEGRIEPLYVGIAQTLGRSGGLSTLFRSGWLRFADSLSSEGHVGKINDCLVNGKISYAHWCNSLFSCTNPPTLRRPVFVDVEVWSEKSESIFSQFGYTPLHVEEAIRIWFLRLAGRSDSLLNKEGNRQRVIPKASFA